MPDLRASAREPSDQRPEHEPGLGCQRNIRGHADDDAERQAQHGSKPDSDADAHGGNGRAPAQRLWSICCRSARPGFRCRCAFTNRESRRSAIAVELASPARCQLSVTPRHLLGATVRRLSTLTRETAWVDGGDAPSRLQATGGRCGLNGRSVCGSRLPAASVGSGWGASLRRSLATIGGLPYGCGRDSVDDRARSWATTRSSTGHPKAATRASTRSSGSAATMNTTTLQALDLWRGHDGLLRGRKSRFAAKRAGRCSRGGAPAP